MFNTSLNLCITHDLADVIVVNLLWFLLKRMQRKVKDHLSVITIIKVCSETYMEMLISAFIVTSSSTTGPCQLVGFRTVC